LLALHSYREPVPAQWIRQHHKKKVQVPKKSSGRFILQLQSLIGVGFLVGGLGCSSCSPSVFSPFFLVWKISKTMWGLHPESTGKKVYPRNGNLTLSLEVGGSGSTLVNSEFMELSIATMFMNCLQLVHFTEH
jgi:hypothetical protein